MSGGNGGILNKRALRSRLSARARQGPDLLLQAYPVPQKVRFCDLTARQTEDHQYGQGDAVAGGSDLPQWAFVRACKALPDRHPVCPGKNILKRNSEIRERACINV
jgi:hypothetical protein